MRRSYLTTRASDSEERTVSAAAEAVGVSRSTFVRRAAVTAARQVLEDVDPEEQAQSAADVTRAKLAALTEEEN